MNCLFSNLTSRSMLWEAAADPRRPRKPRETTGDHRGQFPRTDLGPSTERNSPPTPPGPLFGEPANVKALNSNATQCCPPRGSPKGPQKAGGIGIDVSIHHHKAVERAGGKRFWRRQPARTGSLSQ